MERIINDNCLNVLPKIKEEFKQRKIVLISDPPYNLKYHYNTYKDNLKENEYLDMLFNVFNDTPSIIIHYSEMLYKIAIKLNKAPIKVVSWCYNSNTPRQHRDIAFFDIKPDFSKVKQPYKNQNDKRIKNNIACGKGGRQICMIGGKFNKLKMLVKKRLPTLAKYHYKLC